MTTDLVGPAWVKAVQAKRPRLGLLHPSARGSPDCARAYQEQLQQFGIPPSMSRKGIGHENAPMERFWGTLKHGLVQHRRYKTRY